MTSETGAGPARRAGLKAASAELHAWVEGVIGKAGLFDSLAGYRAYLETTFVIRSWMEQALTASGVERLLPDWPKRRIAHLLAADITDLAGYAPAPALLEAHLLSSDAEILGTLYVLEGSSLGARVLIRAAARLGLSAEFGARHLHRQAGERTAWRDFLDCLAAADLDDAGEAALGTAALSAFRRFGEAYQTHLAAPAETVRA